MGRLTAWLAARPARATVAALLLLPTTVLLFLVYSPDLNLSLNSPVEHLVITTNVSLLALALAMLVARAAAGMGQYGILLTATGFMSMAGTFLVHGLATPGMLLGFDRGAEIVVGASAYLSLLVPAAIFAARYSPVARWMERQSMLRSQGSKRRAGFEPGGGRAVPPTPAASASRASGAPAS